MAAFRSYRSRLVAFGIAVVAHVVSLPLLAGVAVICDEQVTFVEWARTAIAIGIAGFAVTAGLFAWWIHGVSRNIVALGSGAATPTLHLGHVWAESQAADAVEGSDVRNWLILVALGTVPCLLASLLICCTQSTLAIVGLLTIALCSLIHVAACMLALQIACRLTERQAAQWRDVQLRAAAPSPDANRLR